MTCKTVPMNEHLRIPLWVLLIGLTKQIFRIFRRAVSNLIADSSEEWTPKPIHEYMKINQNLGKSAQVHETQESGFRTYRPFNDNDFVSSVLPYQNPMIRELVYELKFANNLRATRITTIILLMAIQNELEYRHRSGPTIIDRLVIVPITASPKRRLEKGFDQCENIANHMSKCDLGLVFDVHAQVEHIIFNQNRFSHLKQKTLARRARQINVKGRFAVDVELMRTLVHGANKTLIVIFDDVTTTGATLRETINLISTSSGLKPNHTVIGLALAH